MDELATCQINSETYVGLEGMLWLEERLNAAILDLRVVSEKQSADQPTKMQNAIGQLTPLGLSNAQAIYHLLKLGYIPSARALIRPMFEYAGITNLILEDDKWLSFWEDGWPKKGRPSLTVLLSNISGSNANEYDAMHELANDFHNALHTNLKTVESNMAPSPDGRLVCWFGPIPSAPRLVENIAHATALCTVVLASIAKRAYFWDQR